MTRTRDRLGVPASLWTDPETVDWLVRRDVAALFTRIQTLTGASQLRIGAAVGLSQAQVSEVMSGRRKVTSIEVYARIVTGLDIPEPARTALLLGQFPPPAAAAAQAPAAGSASTSDITAVFPTRLAFAAAMPIGGLLAGARTVRACGLSLNLICQHYADHDLYRLATATPLRLLLLDPDGEATTQRETEEGHRPGTLAQLTRMNLDVLTRLAHRLPRELSDNLQVGVYDETIRFNLLFIDDHTCVAQPYLPADRGLNSPTIVMRRRPHGGLFPTFERVFDYLWQKRKPL